jgi:NAD(P)-dependent dehydrogenase (short-subunit alcohol dehydrogenase family)
MVRLRGKVAVVIGAGGGIGRAIAVRLAAEEASVVVADVANEAGARTAQMIRDAGGEVDSYCVP